MTYDTCCLLFRTVPSMICTLHFNPSEYYTVAAFAYLFHAHNIKIEKYGFESRFLLCRHMCYFESRLFLCRHMCHFERRLLLCRYMYHFKRRLFLCPHMCHFENRLFLCPHMCHSRCVHWCHCERTPSTPCVISEVDLTVHDLR